MFWNINTTPAFRQTPVNIRTISSDVVARALPSDTIKEMIDIESLSSQVKHNCNISDARHWGYYSLCGLLLRLRELYRSEQGIPLWGKMPQEDIGRWIASRENLWRELEDKELTPITTEWKRFRPVRDRKDQRRTGKARAHLRRGTRPLQEAVFFPCRSSVEKNDERLRCVCCGGRICPRLV